MSTFSRLVPGELKPEGATVLGCRIEYREVVDSTQRLARELGREGAPEGTAVFAETQTSGRGRQGRGWFSPPGAGLWFSLILRPELPPASLLRIPVMAAIAMAEAVTGTAGCQVAIKWPNDLLWEGRKFCGILAERVAEPGRPPFVVLGIGVNVDLEDEDFPPELCGEAVSLRVAAGRSVCRATLARRALMELDRQYRRLREEGFTGIRTDCKRLSAVIGRDVLVRTPEESFAGRAVDLDEDGALVVAVRGVGVRRLVAGDVSLRLGTRAAKAGG